MGEHKSVNKSAALQIWAIGLIAPLLTIAYNIIDAPFETDHSVFWHAGQMALSGNLSHLYDVDGLNFPYPPHALFLFLPLGGLGYIASYLLWTSATAALFWWAARPYFPADFPSVLALLTPGALMCIAFGQTGLLVGALWLIAFRAGWPAVALLTVKPHLGVLSALSLRSWRAVAWTALATLALIAASVATFGQTVWADFVDHSIAHASVMRDSVRWQFAGVTPGIAYGLVGWLPFAIAAALLLARKVDAFTAATAALLIAPYGFHYDMALANLGIGLFIFARWHSLSIGQRIIMALAFYVPTLASLGVWFMPPILLAALWVQVGAPHAQPTNAARAG